MAKAMELSPQECEFARLRAQGFDQTHAFQQAFDAHDKPRKSVTEAASRLAAKPQVVAMLKDLYRAARKISLLSHGEFLSRILDDWNSAREAENWTAAASFARLAGSAIGSLSDHVRISDERMSEQQLLDRLGSNDPVLTERIRAIVAAKRSFDA